MRFLTADGSLAAETQAAAGPERARFDHEIATITCRRLVIGGAVTLPFIAFYAGADLWLRPGLAPTLLALKLPPAAVALLAVFTSRLPVLRQHAETLAAVGVLALGITAAASSIVERDVSSMPILVTSLGLTAAVYLPWGARCQALVSAALFVLTAGALVSVLGPNGLGDGRVLGTIFGMAIVLGNAPVVASTIRSLVWRNLEVEEARARLSEALARRLEDANRKLEQRGIALEQALEEAEKANVSKSRFLASMSHEFRTPLTSILGFAGMLRNGAAGPVNPKQLDYASEICTSAEHLLRIVEGVLKHARIEAHEDPMQLSDVPVDLLVEVACRQMTPTALEKEITIRRSPPSGCRLVGDKQKLLQVMLNLLSNAIKFSPPRSEIGADVRDLGDGVEIVVWDHGIGLVPEDVERVFRPFEQVQGANRTSQKGTGLGLAICRRLVELHGGTVGAESEIGRGSRFRVWLPRAAAEHRDLPLLSA